MKVGIMQPYLFPYLAYWQLIHAVDKFVLLDDVNYIKRGFINSNSILVNGRAHKFSVSLKKPSQNRLIMDTKLFFPMDEKDKFLKTIKMSYGRAPCFAQVYPLIEDAVYYDENDLTSYIKHSIELINKYAGIKVSLFLSSEIEKDNSLRSSARIIEINKRLGGTEYINPAGGVGLYDKTEFEKEGITLKFINMLDHEYQQFGNEFVPGLSIIDVLMFNRIEDVKSLLDMYKLV